MIDNLWVVFITGLTVGGLTCLAVQGGLLASVLASKENENPNSKDIRKKTIIATGAFLISKLISYASLGFVLCAFGSALSISDDVQVLMQLAAGLYMVAVALNLLEVHPIFRYVIFQPPKFLTKLVRNQTKSKDLFAPALLGAMTVFIPCGTTIAMETLAISSANPIYGAAIMAAFTLGTIPAFLGIGVLTSFLGETFKSKFLKVAAFAVLYLGVTSIWGSFTALGFTFQVGEGPNRNTKENTAILGSQSEENQPIDQEVEINITSSGYSPAYIQVKQGSRVRVTLIGKGAYSCAAAFRIPSLGISENLSPNDKVQFSFTPQNKGKIPFNCSMGMYTGVIEVL